MSICSHYDDEEGFYNKHLDSLIPRFQELTGEMSNNCLHQIPKDSTSSNI